MDKDHPTDFLHIDAVAALARKAASDIAVIQRDNDGELLKGHVFINRETGKVENLKPIIDSWRARPERKTGTARVLTLESFIDLTKRHMTPDSAIFADTDWRHPSMTAVIDYHVNKSAGAPDNGKHRIHYAFPLSEEWKKWQALDGEPMNQGEFAEFIENRISEITSPTFDEETALGALFSTKIAAPNELIMLSRGLQVRAEMRVKNAVTLQSGEGEITFEEEHKDAAGNKLQVPGIFIINIAPFFLGEPARIPARLRYRVREGKIVWAFHLYRPDRYITDQVCRDTAAAALATELPVFHGAPEMTA